MSGASEQPAISRIERCGRRGTRRKEETKREQERRTEGRSKAGNKEMHISELEIVPLLRSPTPHSGVSASSGAMSGEREFR